MSARIGLGTYRCARVAEAAALAADHDGGWVDTAPNYLNGQAEAALAAALAAHPDLGVSTKVGFVPASVRSCAIREGALSPGDAARGHCLEPDYVAWQVARSARNLGTAPDLVFVHNPEHGRTPGAVAGLLTMAFGALEEACARGVIGGYGVATWSGFDDGLFAVSTLVQAATMAGGPSHHLRAVQLPVSLVRLKPAAEAIDGHGVLIEAADAGLEVFCSAPLHGGELPGLVTTELACLIRPGLTAAQAALALVASAPNVSRVLVSASSARHWQEAADAICGAPVPAETLRKVVDVLGT